ncbi:MAG: hypothetical protein HDS67_03260 [Bacteroidales bacterium]|nr:hypothetical protein [Bacteroidales bacterium]
MKVKNWEVGSHWFGDLDGKEYQNSDLSYIYKIPATACQPIEPLEMEFLSTCRSAIGKSIDNISFVGDDNDVALVPAFTCQSVLEPFIQRRIKCIPYPINMDLSIDVETLFDLIKEHIIRPCRIFRPCRILIHAYFGFDTLVELRRKLKEEDCFMHLCTIEDRTQSMFSNLPKLETVTKVGSIRKWFPIPDGSYVAYDIDPDDQISHEQFFGCYPEHTDLIDAKKLAFRLKNNYIMKGEGSKNIYMQFYSAAEQILNSRTTCYAMSTASKNYLSHVDYDAMKIQRINNYQLLSNRLRKHEPYIHTLFPEVENGIVPFMLPVLIREKRKEFQDFMAKHNVFPTIIWSCPDTFRPFIYGSGKSKINYSDTKALYDSILCFHIDQRYNERDMEKVADIIDQFSF